MSDETDEAPFWLLTATLENTGLCANTSVDEFADIHIRCVALRRCLGMRQYDRHTQYGAYVGFIAHFRGDLAVRRLSR